MPVANGAEVDTKVKARIILIWILHLCYCIHLSLQLTSFKDWEMEREDDALRERQRKRAGEGT